MISDGGVWYSVFDSTRVGPSLRCVESGEAQITDEGSISSDVSDSSYHDPTSFSSYGYTVRIEPLYLQCGTISLVNSSSSLTH